MQVRLRPAQPNEQGHILDSWTRSFTRFTRPHGDIAKWAWFRIHRAGVRDLLESSLVVVAVHPEIPDQVIGWVCFEPAGEHPCNVHFVYVKRDLRRRGVGSMLMSAATATADTRGHRETHRTRLGRLLTASQNRPPMSGPRKEPDNDSPAPH